jgi:ribonuclease E
MLIDATHAEETRVVVVDGYRLQEFDFETSTKRQLKGNIYLAKVTRVEPSLQAAFVDYGGGRDGFLPFNEIHPDYYQIPIADRQALIERQAAADAEAARAEEADAREGAPEEAAEDDWIPDDAAPEQGEDEGDDLAPESAAESDGDDGAEAVDESVEDMGGDEYDEVARVPVTIRPYKIQEVLKRRQIILIQVVKEERGNKGAALTTYLSLAGRYCVLMPNTTRGGGISRKIVSAADRKRLRDVIESLDMPSGMGVIVRTAGMNRTKPEMKRDLEYMLRLWDDIRETTLNSSAPSLVYEEANLIKRSIRDLYTKDIDEILVEGDDGYRAAKDFMRMLMPSRAKVVQPYRDHVPLLSRYKVEEQFDSLYSPNVNLKSGGYIVINPTEALVSIDVNSGRATKERNIELTALKTNLEAADELVRQIRLRDLSGLIVIDFIDMDVSKNKRAVERRLKERLKSDRARIQVGRISAFGLLEMSRQRLRPSILETSGETCVQCAGMGIVRSTESSTLHALRAIEEEGLRKAGGELNVRVATPVALYLLNFKRANLAAIEERYDLTVFVLGDDNLVAPEVQIERQKDKDKAPARRARRAEPEAVVEAVEAPAPAEDEEQAEEAGRKRRRKPRRRMRARDEAEESGVVTAEAEEVPATEEEAAEEPAAVAAEGDEDEAPRKRRRRGKRGGRRRSRASRELEGAEAPESGGELTAEAAAEGEAAPEAPAWAEPAGYESEAEAAPEAVVEVSPEAEPEQAGEEPPATPRPRRRRPSRRRAAAEPPLTEAEAEAEVATPAEADEAPVAPPPSFSLPEPLGVGQEETATGAAGDEAQAPEEEIVAGEESLPPAAAAEDEEPHAAKAPARRGWWRRPSI